MQNLNPRPYKIFRQLNAGQWLKAAAVIIGLFLYATFVNAQEVKMYAGCNVVLSGSVNVIFNNTAFKNNGTFKAGASTVRFTGNNDTTIASISGTSNTTFNNLTLNKSAFGIAVKSWVGVKNILTVSSGKLYANSNLTLLSDSDNTARLAVVPSGANIYGNAHIERYIPSKRSWRLMTAPATSAATIYNSWQNGGVYTVGRGLLVSAPAGGNGLDNSNAASLKRWNVATQTFYSITNTYTSMSNATGNADNIGYFVFIRGDRNPNNFGIYSSNNTTITSTGILQTGLQTFPASSNANAYTLIGNPYASPIDFSDVTRTNLLKRFYVWDPKLNAFGGYVTIDDLDNDGIYSKSPAASAQTEEIQSSQAFFVQTTANGAASLAIDESAKSTTNNLNVFRPLGNTTSGKKGSMRANLYYFNTDGTLGFADGALAEFATGFETQVTNEDAIKFSNINETVAFNRNNSALAIERHPLIGKEDTLFIKVQKTIARNYQLQLEADNVKQRGLTAYLEDAYLATSQPISLEGSTSVNFTVDANAGSAAADRFRIVFKKVASVPTITKDLYAYNLPEKIQVDWQLLGDSTVVKYELERSGNGISFDLVNTASVNAAGKYSWTDITPFAGKNFYRVKGITGSGEVKYTDVTKTLFEAKNGHFSIQPNPVTGNIIHVQFDKQPGGSYRFNLINSDGQTVFTEQAQISSTSTSKDLHTKKTLSSGLYQLQITGPDNKTETQKALIQQ